MERKSNEFSSLTVPLFSMLLNENCINFKMVGIDLAEHRYDRTEVETSNIFWISVYGHHAE